MAAIDLHSNFFDVHSYPIVYMKNDNIDNLTPDIIEEYKKDYLKILIYTRDSGTKIYFIVNILKLKNIPMKHMYDIFQFSRKVKDYNQLYIAHIFILCKNSSTRTFINSFFLVEKPVCPVDIIKNTTALKTTFLERYNIDIDNIVNTQINQQLDNTTELVDNSADDDTVDGDIINPIDMARDIALNVDMNDTSEHIHNHTHHSDHHSDHHSEHHSNKHHSEHSHSHSHPHHKSTHTSASI